ncbi:bet1-like SNARE 1-1 [Aristolochia californica]|uniref:bet1-like SNARE 1-1 n=1 Tax=Aristolochia californica TaxID=171875 RepID=UPI0035E258A7
MEAMDNREINESLFDEIEEGRVRAFTLYSCNEIEEIEEEEVKENESLHRKPSSRLKRLPDGRLSLENDESDIEEMAAFEFFFDKLNDDDHIEASEGFFYRTLDRVNAVLETETGQRVVTVLGTLVTASVLLYLWSI